jgi:T5SS/PEP-CTERM-associated repeat protein
MPAAHFLAANTEYVGYNGRGAVVQSAGTNNVSTELYLGYNAGSSGAYALSGPGVLSIAGNQFIGNAGTGALDVSDGGYASNADANLGLLSGSSGSVTVDGPGSQWINSSVLAVGIAGTGSLGITNGGFVSSINGRLGRDSGTGTAIVSGPSSRWQMTGDLSVGALAGAGTGTLSIQDEATVHVGNLLSINSASNVNLDGGTLRFNTIDGINRLNFTSGTIQLAGHRNISSSGTDINTLFPGSTLTIPSGKGLTVEGEATFYTWVDVLGGRFTADIMRITGFGERLVVGSGGTATAGFIPVGSTFANLDCSVTITGAGSTLNAQSVWVGYEDPGTGTLTITNQGSADIDDLALSSNGRIILDGGTLRLDSFGRDPFGLPGTVTFNAGTLQMRNNRSLATDPAIKEFFGTAINLAAGKGLTIEGTATIDTSITIDGGTFSVGQLAGAPLGESLRRGTLNVTNQAITIGPGGSFGSQLEVDDNMTVSISLGLTNNGLITSDGQIGGTITNAIGGELRGEAGKTLTLTGTGNTNDGRLKLSGGEINFTNDLTNNVAGTITGNGSLAAAGGLTNVGTMNFAGTANIDGPITNAAGGKITSAGGGATIFYDDVINDGEIRTSNNGFTIFFGEVSGAGTFTGNGTVNFEGNLSPGNSPAAVSFGGDVAFGADARLRIELGGTAPGTDSDLISVTGDLVLDGALDVILIDEFTPTAGDSFNILDWFGSLSGAFTAINLPTLAGLTWDTAQIYVDGTLSISAAPGLPGDFNLDGVVDGADYVMWAKGGVPNTTPNYNVWRTNFGRTSGGSGGVANEVPAVPEPASAAFIAMICLFGSRILSHRVRFGYKR